MGVLSANCTDGTECPENLPYCTPVGCVYTCPANVYINGTTCVQDCGKQFILDKRCVLKCPETHAYIWQKVGADQTRFYALNFCVEKCPLSMYNDGQNCVDACPADRLYLLNSSCVEKCPVSHQLKANVIKNGKVVAIECRLTCSGEAPIKHGNICLNTCDAPFYIFNNECLNNCPDNASFLSLETRSGITATYCKETCPSYILNQTCVNLCPPLFLLYKYKTCVAECPADAPINTSYPYLYMNNDPKFSCTTDCDPHLLYKDTCVLICPGDTVLVNKTCKDACPSDFPYVCDEKKEKFCRPDVHIFWIDGDRYNNRCVRTCPVNTLVDELRCVSKCSESKKVFNNSCLNECPSKFPFVNIVESQRYECVSECPSNSYHDNSTCVQKCTGGKMALEVNRTCVDFCPLSHYVTKGKSCYDQCPESWLNNSGECVLSCPSNFALNNTCVQRCPLTHPLLLKSSFYRTTTFHCVNQCPEDWYRSNETCIETCKRYIAPGNLCVEKCPIDFPFLIDYYPSGWHCIDKCPDGSMSNDGTCVEQCPAKLHFNNSCITSCPSSHPYITATFDQKTCASSCSNDECAVNSTCIKLYNTDYKVVYQGKCLQECPQGYLWLSYTTRLNKGSFLVCYSVPLMHFLTVLFALLAVFWLLCCWRFSSSTEHRCGLLRFVCCEACTTYQPELHGGDWVIENDAVREGLDEDETININRPHCKIEEEIPLLPNGNSAQTGLERNDRKQAEVLLEIDSIEQGSQVPGDK